MNFKQHFDLANRHATLSASKYHWINYDEEKLINWFVTQQAAALGSELHELAMRLIKLGKKLPRNGQTLSMYVNDAIGFRMTPEQVLAYSINCFGTVDAISFRDEKEDGNMVLRVHDLKTGVTPASMKQLFVYVAYFCLEYEIRPADITIICRIYQNDQIVEEYPELDEIVRIMDKTIRFDKIIEDMKANA